MQLFPVSKHCDCFQYGVHGIDHELPVKRWTCLHQLYRGQLAVSHRSHKIVVLSALSRLGWERNNNSCSSVNPPLIIYTYVWSEWKQLVLFSRESWCFPRRSRGLTDLTLNPWAPPYTAHFLAQDFSHILHEFFVGVLLFTPHKRSILCTTKI